MSIESRSRQYGVVFDHWQIREFLGSGSGGQSAVFKLHRVDSARGKSALKIITLVEERGSLDALPAHRRDEYEQVKGECRQSAEQEVWLMDALHGNTNIVDYLDHTFVDWSDEKSFGCDMLIRMELLEDLRGKLRAGQYYPEAEILKIGKDICTALILCHGKGILHRDIKPENIFINTDGNYKLGDFGVSRILSASPNAMATTGIGTPEYAAPEQFTGRHDRRIDIYSLGLVLYELSNGNKLPFASTSYARQEDIWRRQSGEALPPPVNASGALAAVILKACAHRKEDRYQTAEEFLDALTKLDGKPAPGWGGYATQPAVTENATMKAMGDIPTKPEGGAAPGVQRSLYAGEGSATVSAAAPKTVSGASPGKKKNGRRIWLAAIVGLLLVAAAMALLFGQHRHTWNEATCSSPQTCSKCGETVGSALEHQWSDASCTVPKTCKLCGKTTGTVVHHWTDATYDAPKTCTVCGATVGTKLQVQSVYINELEYHRKYGKVWTMSEQTPEYFVHTDIGSGAAYKDLDTPGHTAGTVRDYLGNEYTYGITVDGAEYAEYYISYDIDGKYSGFTGTYCMSADMETSRYAAQYSKYFEVYGDGVLLFRSSQVTDGSAPRDFNIDVSGVRILTILYPLVEDEASGPNRMATIFDGKLS